jgi:4-hydroxy-4-methyl-2-oxoglutarate aldolase
VDGRLDVCTLGGLLALRGKERGLAGFLVNGCVRDAADIRATGFGVHCLGTSPRKSSVELETASIGEPVTIGGCLIGPGDFIVADDTGAVVIPAGDTDRVLALALDIKRREDLVTGRIGAGSSLAGAFESIGD